MENPSNKMEKTVNTTKRKRKPDFIRQDAHKKPKLGYKWRKPKGSDSKIRKHLKGYRVGVSVGWKKPLNEKNTTKMENILLISIIFKIYKKLILLHKVSLLLVI